MKKETLQQGVSLSTATNECKNAADRLEMYRTITANDEGKGHMVSLVEAFAVIGAFSDVAYDGLLEKVILTLRQMQKEYQTDFDNL